MTGSANVPKGHSTTVVNLRWLCLTTVAIAAVAGLVFGTAADPTIFLLVRPTLPPPWRWLPATREQYAVLCLGLLVGYVLLMYGCWRTREGWRWVVGSWGVFWIAAFLSQIVVEELGEREGPVIEGAELLFRAFFVASFWLFIALALFFVSLALVSGGRWVYSKFFGHRAK